VLAFKIRFAIIYTSKRNNELEIEMETTAYEIGYNAALNDGQCIFAYNEEAVKLLEGNQVGHPDNEKVMRAFIDGVRDGGDELCNKLMES